MKSRQTAPKTKQQPTEWTPWDKKWFSQIRANRQRLVKSRAEYSLRSGKIIGLVRTFAGLKKAIAVDLVKFIDPLMAGKKPGVPLEVLDSGAGYGFISAGLAERYGSKVRVTALGFEEPPSTKVIRREIRAALKELRSIEKSCPGAKIRMQILSSAEEYLPRYSKYRKQIQRVRVFFENYMPEKQYDLIIDFTGPMQHTHFHTRTAEQIFNLLKPNGTAILKANSVFTKQAQALADPNGKYARQTGHYLTIHEGVSQFDIITKVPVPKRANAKSKFQPRQSWTLRTK